MKVSKEECQGFIDHVEKCPEVKAQGLLSNRGIS